MQYSPAPSLYKICSGNIKRTLTLSKFYERYIRGTLTTTDENTIEQI